MKKTTRTIREYGLSKQQAEAKLAAEGFDRIPVSFYRYVKIDKPQKMQERLMIMWKSLDCLGRIYIATEGINAQMSVPEHVWDIFKDELYKIPEFANIPLKIGVTGGKAFIKLKIKDASSLYPSHNQDT